MQNNRVFMHGLTYNLSWLKEKFDKGEHVKYIFFWGNGSDTEEIGKFVFSQWYAAAFVADQVHYKTAEHWMMAAKARMFGDNDFAEKIVQSVKPGEAKELGRGIRGFDSLRWDKEKFAIVIAGNVLKFTQHPKLKEYLISTGDRVLVEASPTDNIWGIGTAQTAERIENPHTWRGLNLLGFALMEVRDILKQTKTTGK